MYHLTRGVECGIQRYIFSVLSVNDLGPVKPFSKLVPDNEITIYNTSDDQVKTPVKLLGYSVSQTLGHHPQ